MLFFLPPITQALIGVALVAVGVLTHISIIDVAGGVGIVVGGYRWLRSRRGGKAIR